MRFIEALKSARKLEIFILLAAAAILLVLALGSGGTDTAQTEPEARLASLLSSIEGAGRVSVMLREVEDGSCAGAVVATEAADEIAVMLQLQRAVQTLTGLELEQIEIVKAGR